MARPKRCIHFTKAAIEELTPPATGRQYVYDTKINGLAVAVFSTGAKVFYVYRWVAGKPEKIKVARWPDVGVEVARKMASKIIGAIAAGGNPNEEKRAARRSQTLQQAFDAYMLLPTRTRSKRPRAAKTLHDYRLQYTAHLSPWADRPLSKITRHDVEELHNRLGANNGHYAANRMLELLRGIYNAAIEKGFAAKNPALGIMPFEEIPRERFLLPSEMARFFEALEAEKSDKTRDAIMLMLLTGQRKTNVLSMRWEDVNLEDAIWELPTTKTGKHRVPLSVSALEILKRRKKHPLKPEFVLPGLHERGHLKDITKAWTRIKERSKLGDLRMHDLRRSLGSWQTATGASLQIVGKMLGHKRPETTQIYARLNLEPVRESLEAATAAIMKAAKARSNRRRGSAS